MEAARSFRDFTTGSVDDGDSISIAPTEDLSIDGIDSSVDDINAGKSQMDSKTLAPEYGIATNTKYLYLGLYFALNLILTLYNKVVLGKFAFPWLLTTLHTGCASLGCYILMLQGYFKITRLTTQQNLAMLAFSILFTINIAISNVSLQMVSVPFHQIMRSTCPVFTILIYRICYNRTYANGTYLSLVPVIFGVGLATFGDYYFSILGFFCTLLGVLLSSWKTVASNQFMTGNLALPALEILLRMSPLAALQSLLYAAAAGELTSFRAWIAEGNLTPSYALALAGNGFLAFLLNVSSFYTNKLAGALTVTVCANLKQCLTVVLGVVLFNVRVGLLNGVGMLVTLIGAAIYGKVELDSKGKLDTEKAQAMMKRDEEDGLLGPEVEGKSRI